MSKSEPITRMLIGVHANVNRGRLDEKEARLETPLVKCIQLNNVPISDLLIHAMCDKEAASPEGFTALHYACAYRRYEHVELLLNNGSDIHAPSKNGVTAMALAIDQQNPALCRLLVQSGYDIDASFIWHETPLEMSIMCHSERCAMTLVHWGCSLRPPEGNPSHFLHAACEGLTDLIRLLVDRHPSYLNEEWIRNRKMPTTFYSNLSFYEWLCRQASQPRTLKYLCRAKIYSYLRRDACVKAKRLPLPPSLIEFITFAEHISESMYEKLSVFSNDCPFDCKPLCPSLECPILDFSSSDEDE